MASSRNQVPENREVRLMKFSNEVLDQRNVKNEECSSEFAENKGAKRMLLMS